MWKAEKIPRVSWKWNHTFAQKTQLSCSLPLRAHGKLNARNRKACFNRITLRGGNTPSVEPKWGWGREMIGSFIEFHSWNFLRSATSISSLFNLHVRILQQRYIRGFSGKPGSKVFRCWRQWERRTEKKTQSFMQSPSCICSENAIQLAV